MTRRLLQTLALLLALAPAFAAAPPAQPPTDKTDAPRASDFSGLAELAPEIARRMDEARRLVDAGRYDEATEKYIWLWNNMTRGASNHRAVRLSFLLSEIETLVAVHEPARKRFESIRQEYERSLRERTTSAYALFIWARLSRILGREDEIIAWHDRITDDPDKSLERRMLSWDLTEIFLERERYADAGRALPEPVDNIRRRLRLYERADKASQDDRPDRLRDRARRAERESIADTAGRDYALCLAADREEEAAAISALFDDKTWAGDARVRMVEWSLRVGEPRKTHLEWLEGVEGEKAEQLRTRLREALPSASD